METAAFYILAGTAVLAALWTTSGRRLVHSALGLAAVALCVALLGAQLGAGFPAAALVLIYAGGIGLAFFLVAALLNLREGRGRDSTLRTFIVCALVSALLAQLGISLWRWNSGAGNGKLETPPAVAELSELLFRVFRLPLEVMALVLLTALVGATLLTRKREKASEDRKGER